MRRLAASLFVISIAACTAGSIGIGTGAPKVGSVVDGGGTIVEVLDGGSTVVTEKDGAVVIVAPDGATMAFDGGASFDANVPPVDSGNVTPKIDASSMQDGAMIATDANFASDAPYVAGDAGSGFENGPCTGVVNAAGTVKDFPWGPGISNVSNDIGENSTLHFHWTGSYNVLEVASFAGQTPPLAAFADAMWATEVKSGAKVTGGTFDWNVGKYPCGYRPGLYYFVSQDDPTIGPISVSLTVPSNGQYNNAEYPSVACSTLASSNVFGGRYGGYANRNCTLYEVNNFQTEAHYDWVPAVATLQQGDLMVFRWTGSHNAIQVHDVFQDTPIAGGFRSGDKSNCVGGPNYSCTNGSPSLGETVFDTSNWRPGQIHMSDEDAYPCAPPHNECTGMNMEFMIHIPGPVVTPGGCCAIDKTKGQACNLIDIYNDNPGSQFEYNFPVNRGDIVRMRWAGSVRIYETLAMNAQTNDAPDPNQPMSNGLSMASAVECIPGPNMSCLAGNTDQALFLVDIDKAIANNQFLTEPYSQKYFDFYATGEGTAGYTSANSGIHFYVQTDSDYSPNPACP
jgi:hypothetical protein